MRPSSNIHPYTEHTLRANDKQLDRTNAFVKLDGRTHRRFRSNLRSVRRLPRALPESIHPHDSLGRYTAHTCNPVPRLLVRPTVALHIPQHGKRSGLLRTHRRIHDGNGPDPCRRPEKEESSARTPPLMRVKGVCPS